MAFFEIALALNITVVVSPEDRKYIDLYIDYRRSLGHNITVLEYEGQTPSQLRKQINQTSPEAVAVFGPFSKIPGFEIFPIPENHYSVNSDFYYSDLISNPDRDGDGYSGEYAHDEVNLTSAIPIGRIPIEGKAIRNWTRRLIFFENTPGSKTKGDLLLLGAMLFYQNEDGENYPVDDGGKYLDFVKNSLFNSTEAIKVYEKEGLVHYNGESTYSLSENFWKEIVFRNIKFASWSAHGSSDGIWRKIWKIDKGDGVAEFNEMEWINIMPLNYFELPFKKFMPPWWAFVAFSNSCSSYEESRSFIPEMLRRSAVAIVASTGIVYDISYWKGPNSGGSSSLNYYFWLYFLEKNTTAGEALLKAKKYYYQHLFKYCDFYLGENPTVNQLNLMGFHLFGDPLMQIENNATDAYPPEIVDLSPGFLTSPEIEFLVFDESGINTTSIEVEDSEGKNPPFKVESSPITQNIDLMKVRLKESNGILKISVSASDKKGNTSFLSFEHRLFYNPEAPHRVWLWPNPFTDSVKVYTSYTGKAKYTLFSASGRKILWGTFKNYLELSPDVPEGLYFLKIDLPGGTRVLKLVKIR